MDSKNYVTINLNDLLGSPHRVELKELKNSYEAVYDNLMKELNTKKMEKKIKNYETAIMVITFLNIMLFVANMIMSINRMKH